MKRIVFILLTVLMCSSCMKKKAEEPVKEEPVQENKLERKSVLEDFLKENNIDPEKDKVQLTEAHLEKKGFIAYVKENEIELKKNPSSESEKICNLKYFQKFVVKGTWIVPETINGKEGFWCYGYAKINDDYKIGWLFSEYLNLPEDVFAAQLETEGTVTGSKNQWEYVAVNKKRYGPEFSDEQIEISTKISRRYSVFELYPFNEYDTKHNKAENCFDPIGLFVLDKEERKIIPVAAIVLSEDEENVMYVTDDNRYVLIDSGTGPGIRGLRILDLTTNEYVFRGSYNLYKKEFDESTVKIVVSPEYFNGVEGFTKEDLEAEIQKFEEENPLTEKEKEYISNGMSSEICAYFNYNYRENTYEYLECFRNISQ